ncbi:vicilin-like seed storage protein At2g18540 isoform X1 [Centruroides sculpturatus]|uniref:vicilin-like seed storage protein At2g18540 isoform X1 n=1 Tax=Centruroides sculpturatus TaxID=218467 RepID=UPI000C6CB1C4|nr:vicilin-like seed storage protein At2g18540 isoform X1 [Centruroides sculpturatus]XP_023225653.1 vicilin-like seed storage protein At2g18540 isoform X1 [Centruroides sculpturatus]
MLQLEKKFYMTVTQESAQRAEETSEDREQRLAHQREIKAAKRRRESTPERMRRLARQRQFMAAKRRNESISQRLQRLEKQRLREAARRRNESLSQRQQRLEKQRRRAAIRRQNESMAERMRRLEKQRWQMRVKRANESPLERLQRIAIQRQRQAEKRARALNGFHQENTCKNEMTIDSNIIKKDTGSNYVGNAHQCEEYITLDHTNTRFCIPLLSKYETNFSKVLRGPFSHCGFSQTYNGADEPHKFFLTHQTR